MKYKFLTFSAFQNVDHKCKFRSKKGMLPFIELNGEEIADSNIIIETLSKKFDKVRANNTNTIFVYKFLQIVLCCRKCQLNLPKIRRMFSTP